MVLKKLLARKRGKKMDARANAQRLSRSAAVACLRVLTAFALALVCSIRCFLEQKDQTNSSCRSIHTIDFPSFLHVVQTAKEDRSRRGAFSSSDPLILLF